MIFNVKWIGAGITRRVLLVGALAFKMPYVTRGADRFYSGCRANYCEQAWSGYRDTDNLTMVRTNPVVFKLPLGLLNVYRRAEPWQWVDRVSDPDEVETMRRWAGFFGDAKADNFGVIDGEIVLLDYDMQATTCQRCGASTRDPIEGGAE